MNKNTAGTVGIIVFLLAVAGAGYWYYDNHSHDRVLASALEASEVLQRDIDRLQAQQTRKAAVTPAATETKPSDQSTPEPVNNYPKESTWQYREKTDSFTNKKIEYAVLKSLNTLELPFPYQGQQHAYLRIYPMYTSSEGSVRYDISLILEHGQFICVPRLYTPACSTVSIKYDNHLFDKWGARRPSDGNTATLDLGAYANNNVNGPGCIAVTLERHKSLAIQAEFFQAGLRTMEFNIEGLNNLPLQQPTQKQTKECGG